MTGIARRPAPSPVPWAITGHTVNSCRQQQADAIATDNPAQLGHNGGGSEL
jgi:hypothetical protein